MTFVYSWWSRSNVTVYVDPKDLKALQEEYAIILVNHRYEIDWLLGLVVAQEIGLLGVSFVFPFFGKCRSSPSQGLKIVGKQTISFVPILGWSWFFAESIFLRRVWETDKKILEHDIQQLLNGYPKDYYFSVCVRIDQHRCKIDRLIVAVFNGL